MKVIGHGHFGTVRLARSKIRSSFEVAIKSIPKSKIDNQIQLLKNELSILHDSDHPNIVSLIDVFEDNDYLHIVMEYCYGGDLFNYLT